LDNITWNDIQDINYGTTIYIGSRNTRSYSFYPAVARYFRISEYFYNTSTNYTSTLYLYEYKFNQRQFFDSSLITDTKTIPFIPTSIDSYVSAKEMTNGKAMPSISFDGGETYVEVTLIDERPDSKFDGYIEKHYRVEGVGMEIKLKLDLTTDTLKNELASVKRYGLIIS